MCPGMIKVLVKKEKKALLFLHVPIRKNLYRLNHLKANATELPK